MEKAERIALMIERLLNNEQIILCLDEIDPTYLNYYHSCTLTYMPENQVINSKNWYWTSDILNPARFESIDYTLEDFRKWLNKLDDEFLK